MDSPKYNRTMHLPWSPGSSKDDRIAVDVSTLLNIPIIISEKLDGSNTSLESQGCFARTHSGAPMHASFDGLKALHATVKRYIPEKIQLFGEYCYALHSITYTELPGYFLLFNVRDLNYNPQIWCSWSEVETWAQEIDVPTVPVLWRGSVGSQKELKDITESLAHQSSAYGPIREGIVVRIADSFTDEDFSKFVMKWVRKDHVNPDNDHWRHQKIIKNKLKI